MKTRICTRCKKEINPKGGFYNHPSGAICVECWTDKDTARFEESFKQVAKELCGTKKQTKS